MENKNTVIDAKIGNLNELTKVLSVKEQAQEQLLVVMKAWESVNRSNLKFEKAQGYALTFSSSRSHHALWGKTIASATSNHFHGLCAVSRTSVSRTFERIDRECFLPKSAFASMEFSGSIRWIPTSMTLVPYLMMQPFKKWHSNRRSQPDVRPRHPQLHLWNEMPDTGSLTGKAAIP
ncbi:MAG: hypothetical protein ACLRYI_20525 [Bacteroides uniformis]